jgi:hypothetical protein
VNATKRFTLTLSVIAVIGLPGLGLMLRMAIQWTRTQDKLTQIAGDLRDLETNSQRDRKAMDRRVRYLEETVWRRG